jgi:hypothetical protein
LDSYESAWLSLVKIHGFSKIKTTWPIRLKTTSFAAQLHNLMKYEKGGVCLRFSIKNLLRKERDAKICESMKFNKKKPVPFLKFYG